MKMKASSNPERIASFSPRLAAQRATLGNATKLIATLKGLHRLDCGIFNPFRVGTIFNAAPRVARASQPWAESCNPVGIVGLTNF